MFKHLPTLLTILALGFTANVARADDPPAPPKPGESTTGQPDAGTLTTQQLEEMLRDLAYEPKDVSLNGAKDIFEVSTDREGWKVYIMVSLSTDRKNVWFDVKFNALTNPELAPAAAWLKLLEVNSDIEPAFFNFDAKKKVHISRAMENKGVTPVVMRKELEWFDGIVRRTSPHWAGANFQPIPKLEPLTDAGRKTLEKLTGTWVVVEQEQDGKKAVAADVEASGIVYQFDGDKCRIKSKNTADLEADVRAEGGDEAMPLDLIFVSRRIVQKGIVKVDGDTMTVCIADPNKPRPEGFEVAADFKGMRITLKRKS